METRRGAERIYVRLRLPRAGFYSDRNLNQPINSPDVGLSIMSYYSVKIREQGSSVKRARQSFLSRVLSIGSFLLGDEILDFLASSTKQDMATVSYG